VVEWLARGRTQAEIAEKLTISPRTAETHRTNILRKLDLKCSADITSTPFSAVSSRPRSSGWLLPAAYGLRRDEYGRGNADTTEDPDRQHEHGRISS
jgi:hypothetical protein